MIQGMHRQLSTIAIVLISVLLSGCTAHESVNTVSSTTKQQADRTVVVGRVISQKLTRDTKLPADLIAYRDVGIYPKVSGFIDWIGVDRGSAVKKGQLLIRMTAPELPAQTRQGIDSAIAAKDERMQQEEELGVLRHQCAAAEAKAKASTDTYRRLKEASAYPGIIAGNDLELAQTTAEADAATLRSLQKKCKSIEAQVQAAANRYQAAKQAALSSQTFESYLRLTAPFAGVISERNVHEGSFVSPPGPSAQPLLRLRQLSPLRLLVPVPEADVGAIVPGASVQFTVSAHPGETFTGTVRRISDAIDINTRTMAVELDVANSNGKLAPGMFAEVTWPIHRKFPTLFVPQSALTKTSERTFVIRLKDGVVEWVDVKPGLSAENLVEVFGNLQEGDVVALRGSDELRPGTHVTAQELKQ